MDNRKVTLVEMDNMFVSETRSHDLGSKARSWSVTVGSGSR